MNTYETTATVEDHGQVHLADVPFEAGTEVEVSIRLSARGTDATEAVAAERAGRLFAALNKARNTESVGPLRREEIYDRKVLR